MATLPEMINGKFIVINADFCSDSPIQPLYDVILINEDTLIKTISSTNLSSVKTTYSEQEKVDIFIELFVKNSKMPKLKALLPAKKQHYCLYDGDCTCMCEKYVYGGTYNTINDALKQIANYDDINIINGNCFWQIKINEYKEQEIPDWNDCIGEFKELIKKTSDVKITKPIQFDGKKCVFYIEPIIS